MNIQRPTEIENIPEFLFDAQSILQDPRDETCCYSIKSYCCPNFQFTSFILFVSLLDIGIFVCMSLLGGYTTAEGDILQIQDETLYQFGSCCPYQIRFQYEFYRLLSSIFIHKDYLQLSIAVIAQLIVGSITESQCSKVKGMLVYLITGLAGNMTCILFSDDITEGNELCIFGLIGAMFGFLIQVTNQLEQIRQIILVIIFYVIINLAFGFLVPGMNNFGHLGSLIVGVICGTIFPAQNREDRTPPTKLKMVGVGILFLYFTGVIYIFFTFRQPINLH